MKKIDRQNAILKIINENEIGTHESLIEELGKLGMKVTQATVSRDIKELRIVKIPYKSRSVYAVVDKKDDSYSGLLIKSVLKVHTALHTVIIKTYPGSAGAVGVSVDSALGDEILGSIAGDDTVLVIAENEKMAEEVSVKIKKLFNVSEEDTEC